MKKFSFCPSFSLYQGAFVLYYSTYFAISKLFLVKETMKHQLIEIQPKLLAILRKFNTKRVVTSISAITCLCLGVCLGAKLVLPAGVVSL